MQHLEHFESWIETQDHLVEADLEAKVSSYVQMFPGRTVPLIVELMNELPQPNKSNDTGSEDTGA